MGNDPAVCEPNLWTAALELPKVDGCNLRVRAQKRGNGGEQGTVFRGTGFAETGPGFVQVLVHVAGMADQFPCSGGHGAEQRLERFGVERSSGEDSDGSVGCGHAGFFCQLQEGLPLRAQQADLNAAEGGSAGRRPHRPVRLERVANGPHAAKKRSAQDWTQHAREHVGVLVGVEVGYGNTRFLEMADLRDRLGFDFGCRNAASDQVAGERRQAGAKNSPGRERGDAVWGKGRFAIDQDDVAADSEGRLTGGARGGLGGAPGSGHERCRSEDAGAIQFQNGLVDAGSKSEVVCIEDEPVHEASVYTEIVDFWTENRF